MKNSMKTYSLEESTDNTSGKFVLILFLCNFTEN